MTHSMGAGRECEIRNSGRDECRGRNSGRDDREQLQRENPARFVRDDAAPK